MDATVQSCYIKSAVGPIPTYSIAEAFSFSKWGVGGLGQTRGGSLRVRFVWHAWFIVPGRMSPGIVLHARRNSWPYATFRLRASVLTRWIARNRGRRNKPVGFMDMQLMKSEIDVEEYRLSECSVFIVNRQLNRESHEI